MSDGRPTHARAAPPGTSEIVTATASAATAASGSRRSMRSNRSRAASGPAARPWAAAGSFAIAEATRERTPIIRSKSRRTYASTREAAAAAVAPNLQSSNSAPAAAVIAVRRRPAASSRRALTRRSRSHVESGGDTEAAEYRKGYNRTVDASTARSEGLPETRGVRGRRELAPRRRAVHRGGHAETAAGRSRRRRHRPRRAAARRRRRRDHGGRHPPDRRVGVRGASGQPGGVDRVRRRVRPRHARRIAAHVRRQGWDGRHPRRSGGAGRTHRTPTLAPRGAAGERTSSGSSRFSTVAEPSGADT